MSGRRTRARRWCDAAIGCGLFFAAAVFPAMPVTAAPPVEPYLGQLDLMAGEEQALIAAFKRNLADKAADEAAAAALARDVDRYEHEVADMNRFCKGNFEQQEYDRRKRVCDAKENELRRARDVLMHRKQELETRRSHQLAQAKALADQAGALRAHAKSVEDRLGSIASFAPIMAACRGVDGVGARRDCLRAGWRQAAEAAAHAEQDAFDRMNARWLAAQANQVRAATARDARWTHEVLSSIEHIRVPAPAARPAHFSDLEPGDVVLLAPEKGLAPTRAIPPADWLYRAADHFASGESFRAAIKTPEAPVSHAVTVVKSVDGHLLFLDHTVPGSRILTTADFDRKYGGRAAYVARPQAVTDGRALWAAARNAALQRKSDYGVYGGRVVCSERAGIAVAKATGLPLDNKRIGPIDITPGDYFDDEGIGKYFVVSPIGTTPKP